MKSVFQNHYQEPLEETAIPEFLKGLLVGVALTLGAIIWILVTT